MAEKTLFDTQIDILLELGRGLGSGLTRRQLTRFFEGKEDLVLKNGIVLASYGETPDTKDDDARALVLLAEKYLGEDERFVFRNRVKGRACVIVGKAASELAKLAVCDPEDASRRAFDGCELELFDTECRLPRGRKLRHFGNHRLKEAVSAFSGKSA